jgi:hypothetical protein
VTRCRLKSKTVDPWPSTARSSTAHRHLGAKIRVYRGAMWTSGLSILFYSVPRNAVLGFGCQKIVKASLL